MTIAEDLVLLSLIFVLTFSAFSLRSAYFWPRLREKYFCFRLVRLMAKERNDCMIRHIRKIFALSTGILPIAAIILVMAALPNNGLAGQSESAQRVFPSPEEAGQALMTAVQAKDH